MSELNGLPDRPPSVEVAARFSDELAACLLRYANHGSDENAQAVLKAVGLEECAAPATGQVVADRCDRITHLLGELSAELRQHAEDLAFREWRQHPLRQYKRKPLTVTRRGQTTTADQLLADLAAIVASGGFVNRDPAPVRLTTKDFAKQPRVGVPEYATSVPSYESPERSDRVRGGRELPA